MQLRRERRMRGGGGTHVLLKEYVLKYEETNIV